MPAALFAQSDGHGADATSTAQHDGAAAAATAQPATSAPNAEAITPEEILVTASRTHPIAGGLMIAQKESVTTNSVSAVAISEKMALASPLQLAATLPGVDAGLSDPYGLSIRSTESVRGFAGTELGWIVDGVPAIDQAYFLPYSETWVDNENIAGVTLIPGTSRINDPVQTAVGGEFVETIRDPADEMGGALSYSYGSYNGQRVFARFDSGYLGNTGLKAFGSYSYSAADSFAQPGRSSRDHADLKLEEDWGDIGKSSLFVSFSDWVNARSNPYSLTTFEGDRKTGDYWIGNYASTYVAGKTSNYWPFYEYTRTNVLMSFRNELQLSDRLKVEVDPYFHWTASNSPGQTSLSPTSLYAGNQKVTIDTSNLYLVNGKFTAMSNTLQGEHASGVNAFARYDLTQSNRLVLGYWFDHWTMSDVNSLTPADQYGNVPTLRGTDPLIATDGLTVAGANYQIESNINSGYIQDTQSFLDDKGTLEVGVKYFADNVSGVNLAPGPQASFSAASDKLLPHVALTYAPTESSQIYINATTGIRPPLPTSTYPNIYSVATGAITTAGTYAKAEFAIGEEFGYRYHDDYLTADVALFNKHLLNHQLSTLATINGAQVTTAVNAGGETMHGATAELALPPVFDFSPYVNGQYLSAKTDSNFAVGSDFLPTAGKTAVSSPEFITNVGLLYQHGAFFGNVLFKYTGTQYSTLMNDQKMPAIRTVDLSLGYHLPVNLWGLHDTVLKLSATNLTNKPYLSNVATLQPNAVATTGVLGTRIAAGTPTYWLAPPLTVMASLSTEF
jgi:iron complex outermembrane recepter protein